MGGATTSGGSDKPLILTLIVMVSFLKLGDTRFLMFTPSNARHMKINLSFRHRRKETAIKEFRKECVLGLFMGFRH